MHDWSDEGVDWKGINDAAEYIGTFLVRWGRVPVRSWKEKYGTVRVYLSLGWHQFHSITHPRYVYGQYPKWLWSLDCRYGSRILAPLNRLLVVRYHAWLYRLAYKRAVAQWPHLAKEICWAADFWELLRGISPPADPAKGEFEEEAPEAAEGVPQGVDTEPEVE